MRWAHRIITPASIEVISLEEAKAELDVYHNDDDVLITQKLAAAIQFVEAYSNRFLAPTVVELQADRFDDVIELPFGPVISVDAIQYSQAGNLTAFTDFEASGQRIAPLYGFRWPTLTLYRQGVVVITFTAGYADGQAPDSLIQAVMLALRAYYEAPAGPQLEAELDAARAVAIPDKLSFL